MHVSNNKKVIIVDDNETILSILKEGFEDKGFWVSSYSDSRQALHDAQKGDFDLLLSDVLMPDVSGFELLRITKEKFPHKIVFMMSGGAGVYSAAKLLKESISIGADKTFEKPFNPQYIFNSLSSYGI